MIENDFSIRSVSVGGTAGRDDTGQLHSDRFAYNTETKATNTKDLPPGTSTNAYQLVPWILQPNGGEYWRDRDK